jgi:hypothetical protein
MNYSSSVALIWLQLRNACKNVQQEHEAKRTELRQLEDELIRSKRDLERQMARAKETATTTAESSEAENLKVCIFISLFLQNNAQEYMTDNIEMLDMSDKFPFNGHNKVHAQCV